VHRRFLAVPALLLGLVLGGCGDEPGQQATEEPGDTGSTSSPSPSAEETSTPEGPACQEVWSDGQNLPRSYQGCLEGSTWVAADTRRCESGQVLVAYADRYYGAKGAVVNDMGESLEENKQYQQALRSCG
jgi:hypothetical protein